MVAERDQIKLEFARRLHEALDDLDECPSRLQRGRASWTAKRYKVSPEAAGKWLDGRSMPDQTNMARIAADLKVSPVWLWSGQLPKRPPPDLEITALWSETDDFGRENILHAAKSWRQARPRGKPHSAD
jgi:hypothetical protein